MAQRFYSEQSSTFWEGYTKGRPKVPQSFWSRIFSYHESHEGHFDVVNDLGSGIGIHSPNLARRFNHVILTDPGSGSLDIARQHLTQEYGNEKYSFVLGTAESNPIGPHSLDMVLCANAMHFTDPPVALSLIASQLKPGGTVAMALFGMPSFSNPKIREIWGRMLNYSVRRLREHHRDNPVRSMDCILQAQDSGYDNIAIPEELFENVKRIKLVPRGAADQPFRMAQGEKAQYPFTSNVSARDELIEEQDDDWAFDHDLQGVKDLWKSFPWQDLDEALITSLWAELEDANEDGRYRGHWVVSLILASKRADVQDQKTKGG